MAPRRRAKCQICEETESKYACPKCNILYCSVSCYKGHKDLSCIERTSKLDATASESPIPSLSERGSTRGQSLTSYPSGSELSELQSSQVVRNDHTETASAQTIEEHNSVLSESKNKETRTLDSGKGEALYGKTLKESVSGSTTSADAGQHLPELSSHAAEPSSSDIRQAASLIVDSNSKVPNLPEQNYDVITEQRPLRKLTSLKWPYVPDEPSYPDPLKRDDPKPLNLRQYESIATSVAVRRALSSHPRLPALLTELDQLRGSEREEELERVLGVSQSQSTGFSIAGLSSTSDYISSGNNFSRTRPKLDIDREDMKALRELAEAVESAVRGERADVLGLDWEAMAG